MVTSKGTIRFQADRPLPAALVRKLVKAQIAAKIGTRRFRGKARVNKARRATPARGRAPTGEGVIQGARYVHTNLIARDWRRLAGFYQSVFGCVPVLPERDLSGPALDAGTGVPGSTLTGVHLRMPGAGADGPTLEIFSYSRQADGPAPAVNRPGFAHIAFAVASVTDARDEVLAAGGKAIGEVVTTTITTGAHVTWCYVTDPEGNIVELQAWSPPGVR